METEPEVEVPKVSEKKAKKHKNSNDSSVSQKKSKTFSVEELKKQLKGNDKSKGKNQYEYRAFRWEFVVKKNDFPINEYIKIILTIFCFVLMFQLYWNFNKT